MERFAKILLLTFIFTMLITSTCFAYSGPTLSVEQKDFIHDYFSDYVSENNPELAGKPYLLYTRTMGSQTQVFMYYFDTDVVGSLYNDIYVKIAILGGFDFYIKNDLSSSDVIYNFKTVSSSSGKTVLISDIQYLPIDIKDSNGDILAESTEKIPEPEIPDIPMIDLPDSGYSKNYAIKYEHEDGSIRLVLFSSNEPIEFLSSVKDKTVSVTFNYTSETKYSTYIFRNGIWDPLINSTYSTVPGSFTQTFTFKNVLSSDVNILNEDGTIFFPQTPLLETIAGEGLTEMWKAILKAMVVIVIAVVSCLALLISLQVLWKVLKTYLV